MAQVTPMPETVAARHAGLCVYMERSGMRRLQAGGVVLTNASAEQWYYWYQTTILHAGSMRIHGVEWHEEAASQRNDTIKGVRGAVVQTTILHAHSSCWLHDNCTLKIHRGITMLINC